MRPRPRELTLPAGTGDWGEGQADARDVRVVRALHTATALGAVINPTSSFPLILVEHELPHRNTAPSRPSPGFPNPPNAPPGPTS